MRPLQHTETIDLYFTSLKSAGLKVPRHCSTNSPSILAISEATGVSWSLLNKKKYRSYMEPYIQEIGLGESVVISHHDQRERRETENRDKLTKYFELLASKGLKLPEKPQRAGEVDLSLLAHEAGIAHGIVNSTQSLRQQIREAQTRLGCEVRVLAKSLFRGTGEVSYKELKEYGTKQRKKEPGGEDRQIVYNLRTHFNTWLKKLGLTPASTVGAELTTDFKTKCEDISKEIDNNNTRKNFVPDMNRWQRYYAEMIGLHDVPGPFHQALSFLIGEKQVTLQHLSRISGVPQGLIKRWSRGEATPVVGSLGHVQSLEKALDAPAGLLTEKLPKPSLRYRFRRSDLPKFLHEDDCLRRKVYAHLPADFTSLEEGKQREVVDYILKEVINGGTEISKRLPDLVKLPYALKEKNWPSTLTSEKERFVNFKTAMTPPIGMRRKKRCKPSSVRIIISFLEGYFGALGASPESENIKTRGLGVPPEQLSLALFVCPELMEWFFKFRFEARHGGYNSIATTMLEHCVALVQTDFGWLRQSPQLAQRLCSVEGFIDESFIERAKNDWGGMCDAALKSYRIHRQTIKQLLTVSRDPFRPIRGIVESDDPMLSDDVRRSRESEPAEPTHGAITLRHRPAKQHLRQNYRHHRSEDPKCG